VVDDASAAAVRERRRIRTVRRQLLGVLLSDAAAVTALTVVACRTRSHTSGPTYAAIAAVAATSLAPGVIAVAREERAHRSRSPRQHRRTGTVALFGAGMVIATAGTVLVLARGPRPPVGSAATAVDVALLIGGNAIGLPYLSRVAALHA
jgi:hypothetical protein